LRQRAFHKGEELLLQQFSPAGKTLFHGILGEIQIRRDGLDGLMLAIKQDERFTVGFGILSSERQRMAASSC